MEKIGVLTYHSAYNFGSVLQAYATQQALKEIGFAPELINYRMSEQKYFYQCIFRTKYGMETAIKDILLLPAWRKRKERQCAYEKFIKSHMDLTEEISEPEDVDALWSAYHAMLSGSDQIWNKNSLELRHNDWRYMDPYLLKGFHGRKISYASSLGSMDDERIKRILPHIRRFDALSFRESTTTEKMARLLERPIENVLDPTFLLSKDEWIDQLNLKKSESDSYILAYFLCGPKRLAGYLPDLAKLAYKRDCYVKVVTPFAYLLYPNSRIEFHPEYGPEEFLSALYNAICVVSDSYHGTVLSVNFGKELYSLCRTGGSEFRKTDILARLELSNRVISGTADIVNGAFEPIDYEKVYEKLDALREKSIGYLRNSLGA